MKVAVKVRLKKSILDPQGKTVHNALQQLGFQAVRQVRIGKLIELEVDDQLNHEQVKTLVSDAAHQVLSNPVIEDFEIEFEEV